MLFSVDAAERECRNLVFADQIRTEGQEEKEKLAELALTNEEYQCSNKGKYN